MSQSGRPKVVFCTKVIPEEVLAKNLSLSVTVCSVSLEKIEETGQMEDKKEGAGLRIHR